MTGLSRNSIEKIFVAVRHRLSLLCAPERKLSTGVYELHESYFGAHRIRGIRGRGAKGKTIVFGILKRSGSMNTFIVNQCSEKTLMTIIKQVIALIRQSTQMVLPPIAHLASMATRNTFRLIMQTTNSQEMVLSTPMG